MKLFHDCTQFVRTDVPLAMHTWLQLGGPCDYFAEPRSADELQCVLARSHDAGLPVRVLGHGSNVLVADSGVSGVVIRLASAAFSETSIDGESVTVGAGAKLGRLVTACVHGGLAGIEGLIGIPGTVGGALRTHTSNHSGHLGEWVESVDVVDLTGKGSTLTRAELSFGYRDDVLENFVVTAVRLKLNSDDPVRLSKRMQKLWIVRRTQQPMGQQGTGHLFKDVRGVSASHILAEAGVKGMRVGGAMVSERDANFVVLDPEATSSDVLALIERVKTHVEDQQGVELEMQIEVW
ncbi:MAG: UDP-N-acetylmuramate dehydrogenase [Thermoguttaceae bacterium]